jgi:hypothetical protein
MNKLDEFWVKLTPTQRVVIATLVDTRINSKVIDSIKISDRLIFIEKVAEGDTEFLIANVHTRLSKYLYENPNATIQKMYEYWSKMD